jgi:hypothetical protein
MKNTVWVDWMRAMKMSMKWMMMRWMRWISLKVILQRMKCSWSIIGELEATAIVVAVAGVEEHLEAVGGGGGGGGGGGSSWLGSSPNLGPTSPRSLAQLRVGSVERSVSGHIRLAGRTGFELGRVLSGSKSPGVVPGSFVLVGGDPGIGKSTLMLQLAAMVSDPSLDFDSAAAAAAAASFSGQTSGHTSAAGFRWDSSQEGHQSIENEQGKQVDNEEAVRASLSGQDLNRVLYVTGEEKEMNVSVPMRRRRR